MKRNKDHEALIQILEILGEGACEENTCLGCRYEVAEAIGIAKEALKKKRKKK